MLNAIVGLYYYLTVLKVVYLYRSDEEDVSVPVPSSYAFALALCSLAIILIGTLSAPWFDWAVNTAQSLF